MPYQTLVLRMGCLVAAIVFCGGLSAADLTKAIEKILRDRSATIKVARDLATGTSNADASKMSQDRAVIQIRDSLALVECASKGDASDCERGTSKQAQSEWQKAVVLNPTFKENFDKTLNAAANGTAVVGPPVPVTWRIISGQATDSFKDCVAVGRNHHFFCSGTVIGKRVVLTAGHCVDGMVGGQKQPEPDMVLFGPSINDGDTIKVTKIIAHPDLNLGRHPFNDVALLILEKPVPSDITIREMATEDMLYNSAQITVVGFGTNSSTGSDGGFGLKRLTDVPIVTYDGSQPDNTAPFGCDVGLEFAASSLGVFRPFANASGGGRKPPHHNDSCNGDSGGPAYVRGIGDSWVIAGTTSRPMANTAEYVSPGEKPTECGDGGIYVRVDKYRAAWIDKAIKDQHLDSPP